MKSPRILAALALGASLLLASVTAYAAHNQSVRLSPITQVEGYEPDRQSATAYRTGISAVDTDDLTYTDISTISTFVCTGKATIAVSPRFNAASSTCTVTIVRYFSGTATDGTSVTHQILGLETSGTITADRFTDANGDYVGPTWLFDTSGATHCKILLDTFATATAIDLHVGSF